MSKLANTPDSLSCFVRFIQLKSLRQRTQEEYVRWVTRLAKHCGVACASLLAEEEVLSFLHDLQQRHGCQGSTLNHSSIEITVKYLHLTAVSETKAQAALHTLYTEVIPQPRLGDQERGLRSREAKRGGPPTVN
jgi:hypothetical protein